MKKKYPLFIFIALIINVLSSRVFAQTVSYTVLGGTCAGSYSLALAPSQVNGKNAYSGSGGAFGVFNLSWTGTQWELTNSFVGLLFSNTTETALNPPCHTIGTFTANGSCVGGTITNSSGDCSNTPIPVELMNFKAYTLKNAIQLNWQTASETHNLGFEIERSTDGVSFMTIDFIKSKGNSNALTNYEFTDNSMVLNTNNYYRLKQIDTDKTAKLSPIISVHNTNKNALFFAPNPANTNLTVYSHYDLAVLNIYDLLGRIVLTRTINNTTVIDIAPLKTGNYIIEIKANNTVFRDKLIIRN